jgi:hypothetical protein
MGVKYGQSNLESTMAYMIGRNSKGQEDLTDLFEPHCQDDYRQHQEKLRS